MQIESEQKQTKIKNKKNKIQIKIKKLSEICVREGYAMLSVLSTVPKFENVATKIPQLSY